MAQSASAILMVRPAAFGFDADAAGSNAFQHHTAYDPRQRAIQEFDAAVAQLRQAAIRVVVAQDQPEPPKPDAVFPNNWLSTWPDGRIFLYPMCPAVRRLERQPAIIEQLRSEFHISSVTDLSASENDATFLESTGAIIFDHLHKTAYGSISARCNEALFTEHARSLGYTPVVLHAADENGLPIYHTNVMMAIQTATAVVCAEALPASEWQQVQAALQATGRKVIAITSEQMRHFAGNVLEVTNAAGQRFLLLSQTAYDAFTPEERAALGSDKQLLPIRIPTIETVGGGSIRCMAAEIFLPPRQA